MLRYAGLVDTGVYEKKNDDRALLGSHVLTEGAFSGETAETYFLAAVCDGVSGMLQGDRAAELTVSALADCCRAGLTRADLREKSGPARQPHDRVHGRHQDFGGG